MNATDDLERQLRSMLADTASRRDPEGLFASVMASTRTVRQRPGLLVGIRSGDVGTAPRTTFRLAPAVLIGLLLVAAALALALIGSQLLRRTEPVLYSLQASPIDIVGDPSFRAEQVIGLPDGHILMIGTRATDAGSQAGPQPASGIFDPATGAFTQTGSPLTTHRIGTATVLADGRVLFAGSAPLPPDDSGSPSAPPPNEIYDPTTGTFTATGPMVSSRYGHTATLLADGHVLIAGGDTYDAKGHFTGPSSLAELYDPETGRFSEAGSTAGPHIYGSAVRLRDGQVLITGGVDGDVLATAEIYDPAAQGFTPTGTMHVARSEHTSTLLPDGRVAVIGGSILHDGSLDGTALASIELFDPSTGTFTESGALKTDRLSHSATLLPDGRVLVVGGYNIDGSPRSAEIFDPMSGESVVAGFPSVDTAVDTGRPSSAVRLDDGSLIVAGNGSGPQRWRTSQVTPTAPEAASPAFTAADPSLLARAWGGAIVLKDGRVLQAGGYDAVTGASIDAQIYDPSTGIASPTGQMAVARSNQGMALLSDGTVLVVGGDGRLTASSDTPRPPAEIYDPATGTFTATGTWHVGRPGPGSGPSRRSSQTHATTLADGRVLVSALIRNGTRALAIYDPVTRTFGPGPTQAGSVGTDRSLDCTGGPPARLLDGRVFIPCSEGAALLVSADGVRFEPVGGQGSWTDALSTRDGRVVVFDVNGKAATFDPGSETYARLGSVPPAVDAELIVLGDGSVLAIGGRSNPAGHPLDDPLRTVTRFDPSTGVSSEIGPMISARVYHTATVLADGRVLIVGGTTRSPDRSDPEPVWAEIFDPSNAP